MLRAMPGESLHVVSVQTTSEKGGAEYSNDRRRIEDTCADLLRQAAAGR